MEFRPLEIDGVFEITPRKLVDHRGYFSEIFRENLFHEHIGQFQFVQDNQSLSAQSGTIRGIHFQTEPFAQGKLVRCLAGSVFDVAVDLRVKSPSFGRWAAVILTGEANNQLWVPPGFGHAFCTLEPNCVISYRVTDYYSVDNDKGVAWDDAQIGVEWPNGVDPDTLSVKDRSQPRLSELPAYF